MGVLYFPIECKSICFLFGPKKNDVFYILCNFLFAKVSSSIDVNFFEVVESLPNNYHAKSFMSPSLTNKAGTEPEYSKNVNEIDGRNSSKLVLRCANPLENKGKDGGGSIIMLQFMGSTTCLAIMSANPLL